MRRTRTGVMLWASLAAAWLAVAAAACPAGAAVQADRIARHVEFLTATTHRLAGSAEGRRAGDYILQELRAMGYGEDQILVQPFPVVQIARDPADCYLEVDGRKVPAEPLCPNGLALSVTGPEGIEGPSVYLGRGDPEDFRGKDLAGTIAVMDFAAGDRWLSAARLGAKAIVFVGPAVEIGPDLATDNSTQWLTSHLPMARLYVERGVAEQHGLLAGARVRLFSRMGYVDVEGRNIVVTVAGASNPHPEAVVAGACAYDTYGPVPFLSPSTRKATNVGGLLELARELRQSPPPLTTALIFFDNNTQACAGQMQFHVARITETAGMIRDRQREAEHLRLGLEVLQRPDELIRGAGGTHLTWRVWLPALILSFTGFGALGLMIWLVVDVVCWRTGSRRPGLAMAARVIVLGGCLALFAVVHTGVIEFQTIGMGDEAASRSAEAYELGALLKFMAGRYDDQRELLTSLRLDLLDLGSELRDSVKGLRAHMNAVPADQQDIQARQQADAALEALLDAAVGRVSGASQSVAQRAGPVRERLAAADAAIGAWRRSMQGHRVRNERFIPQAHAAVGQAVARLIERGPALEQQIEQVDQLRLMLGQVRLSILDGQVGEAVRQPFEEIMASRRGQYQARLAEIQTELAHLEAAREVRRSWNGRVLRAMLYFNLAPTDAAWAPTMPSPGENIQYQGDHNVLEWVRSWTARVRQDGTMSRVSLVPQDEDLLPQDDRLWRVSAQTTLVIPMSNPGAAWPIDSHPGEPAPDVPAYAASLAEAQSFLRELEQQEVLHRFNPSILSFYCNMPKWDDAHRRYEGSYVMRYGGGSPEAQTPVPGAIVAVGYPNHFSGGKNLMRYQDADQWRYRLARTTQLGNFTALGDNYQTAYMLAVLVDERGRITHITQFQPGADEAKSDDWNEVGSFYSVRANNLCLFEASAISLAGLRSMEPKEFAQLHDMTNSKNALRMLRPLRGEDSVLFPRRNLSADRGAAAVYVGKLRRYKLVSFAPMMLNNSPEDQAGIGYTQSEGVVDALKYSAQDLWELNQSRLGKLERYGIFEQSLSHLHEQAERHLGRAEGFDEQRDPVRADAHRLASLQFSNLAYEPTRTTTDDLIKAVVILLLLAIPFAFAVERVVIGTPNVYRQIAGFAAVFLGVFAILYFAHPAFRFATFPMLVLLAFVIIILSGLVITIMKNRFEYEVRKLQGIATASHRSSRNARQTISAAITQGIASMRRRPVRTLLTALTIILLTFTIMFFGSFSTTGGIRPVFVAVDDGPPRVEIALSGGRLIDGPATLMLRRLWQDRATSYIRHWMAVSADWADMQMPVLLPNGEILGIDATALIAPQDIALYPALRQALTGDLEAYGREGGILLPRELCRRLNLATDGSVTIQFSGEPWVLRGSFDPAALEAAKMADGASFVPPDVVAQRKQIKQRNPGSALAEDWHIDKVQLRQIDPAAFSRVDPRALVVMWDPKRRDDQGAKGVVLLAGSEQDAQAIGVEAATLLDEPVIVVANKRADRVFYTTKLAVTGFRTLIVPLILGGLIIFGTMLSSVTDRRREVFTLSALGLAPVHVAILFFAEAAVYSVIGGMAGYLLSQAFGKTVQLMAKAGWLTAPAMNYSSMNAMFSILLVMATVLISTVYPAVKASRSANPGIQRRWRMPPPQGDSYDIRFPFTVSGYDMVGLISFLEEYFLSHADRSMGSFAADQVRVEHADGRFSLSATAWLQPFDQGVCQTFRMQTVPSDIEGIDEIHIRMDRQAGSPAIWQRSSNTFIEDIRQQFIFWRTIDEDSVDHYHQRTVQRFALTEARD